MYPILRLNRNITHILQDIISANIVGNINNGLVNQINIVDDDSHISTYSFIIKKPDEEAYTVTLSAAFCQFFWLISDTCMKMIDLSIIKEECKKINTDLPSYKMVTERILQEPLEYIILMMQRYPGISPIQYLDYLRRSMQLLDETAFLQNIMEELKMASSILEMNSNIDLNAISKLDIDGLYEQKVNSVYCYGIAFVLLHELSHLSLGHFEKGGQSMQKEVDADLNAFWAVFSDIRDDRRFSAYVGILCMMFSLMMTNPNLHEDGVHPREDKRIFAIYDKIKGENPKYTVLLIKLFTIWSIIYKKEGFPVIKDDTEVSLQMIRDYFDMIPRNKNAQ